MTINYWLCLFVFFFKQKTAYEMRISDWSSDVCSSDLLTDISLEGKLPQWSSIIFTPPDEADLALVAGHLELAKDPAELRFWMRYLFRVPDQIGRASCRESVCQYV